MVYYDYTYIYVALHGDIRVRHKRKVTIQNPISIPLALHLDVASRHMKRKKTAHSCKHDSQFVLKFRMALNSHNLFMIFLQHEHAFNIIYPYTKSINNECQHYLHNFLFHIAD